MTQGLSRKNYHALPNFVEQNSYDFANTGVGIVHLGIGAFHRGHQAVYTHDAMHKNGGDWRITGVSLRSASVAKQLNPQDGLFTVSEKSDQSSKTRLITSVKNVLHAQEELQEVINVLAAASTKIVTITVTEKGYHYNMAKACLAENSQDIQHDIANPNRPKTMPGLLLAGIKQRMLLAPHANLSVISCDNLPENGEITRQVIVSLAQHQSQELQEWISTHISFCSSMVDRIVPAVSQEQRQNLATKLGVLDEGMIETESFKQWVIEDNFCTSTPNWQAAGVLIVDDVSVYEKLKLRTLNGAHSALAYMGVMLGYKYIHEAISDPVLLAMTNKLMQEETGKSLNTPKGIDLASYQQAIIERFKNAGIAYRTQQVAMDGSQKMIQRIFAPIMDNLVSSQHQNINIMTSVCAAWMIYLHGKTESGESFDIVDPSAELLINIVNQAKQDSHQLIEAFIENDFIPQTLANNERFKSTLLDSLKRIKKMGLREHLKGIL